MQGVETAQMQCDCLPATWGDPVIEDKDFALPPNRKHLIAWISEWEKRLKELQELERRFMATRDPMYLKDFMYPGEFSKVDVCEKIEGPFCMFDVTGYFADGKAKGFPAEEWLKERNAIAKELFPGIEIREVKTVRGPMLGYIGVTSKVLHAAIGLRRAQLSLAKDIAHGREAFEAQNPSRNRVPDGRGR